MAEIYTEIGELDSLKQELFFLRQKYQGFPFVQDEYKGKTIFDVFEAVGNDEKQMKQILTQSALERHTVDYKGTAQKFDFFKEHGLHSYMKYQVHQISQSVGQVMHDIMRYREINANIHQKNNQSIAISGEQNPLSQVADFYRGTILSRLRKKKEQEKIGFWDEGEIDSDLAQFLGIDIDASQTINPEIESLVWKYDFFKRIQQSVEKGYVLSYREMELINDIIKDLKNGEVVLMTGDTGSGKTELAKFLVKEYMQSEYVFVSGNKEMEVSDLTLEKNVTSRSLLDTDTHIVDGKEETQEQQAVKFLEKIVYTNQFKQLVLQKAEDLGKSQEEIQKIGDELQNIDLLDKKLITEYHLMGVYKAAKLGIACIIDETNIIRPEVLMALNDTLTKHIGDTIQLPNALDDITVKKGFCIILTGNDPEQNKNAETYSSGRYKFDEATYNRLRVYAKNYARQIIETHKENKIESVQDYTLNFLEDNELYGIVLMMMFGGKENLNHSGKYGFEIMKKDFEGKYIGKKEFFKTLKSLSKSISLIQRSFSNEVIPLSGANSTFSLKDHITRKVFSMRNLTHVIAGFKNDTLPIEYHIWNEFVKHTTNTDEQYALLLAFSEFGLFGDLITDNREASINNIKRKIRNLKTQENTISITDIENKVTITKQDMYKTYFGSMDLGDDFFEKNIENIHQKQEDNETQDEDEMDSSWIDENIEVTEESLQEIIQNLDELVNQNEREFDLGDFFFLTQFFKQLGTEIRENNIDTSKYNILYSALLKMTQIFKTFEDGGEFDADAFMNLVKDINN
ncbi:hypothetical protein CSB09_02510 [Candidatus Gracilibacteria bacterium]|nr:MAG: hypothetical protein CSB09_02510 [Candidatus Gracilibacteria bacterium]